MVCYPKREYYHKAQEIYVEANDPNPGITKEAVWNLWSSGKNFLQSPPKIHQSQQLKRLNRKTTKIPTMRFSRREDQNIADKPSHPVLVKKVRPRRKTITIEPMSFEQAKERVAGYIKKKGTAATDELAEKLHLDIRTLISVLNELQNEGHIREMKE